MKFPFWTKIAPIFLIFSPAYHRFSNCRTKLKFPYARDILSLSRSLSLSLSHSLDFKIGPSFFLSNLFLLDFSLKRAFRLYTLFFSFFFGFEKNRVATKYRVFCCCYFWVMEFCSLVLFILLFECKS
ncbi:hypothetical protein I3842_16G049900 [Carya illinoinensis]|uniref:Uncharacterized protein n=1 Tax=Carya illinoinensis TaxID=32201 RepID=A0A922A709_CARIL|nr:hypothetical protein I3842_16G049900 [Carya illinoinensis]